MDARICNGHEREHSEREHLTSNPFGLGLFSRWGMTSHGWGRAAGPDECD